MPPLLIAAFLITALLYASVGFGGGSTYNALLVLSGADYRVMPLIALVCNVIVVCGGIWRFARTGDLSARRLLPFLAASVPAAWIGGRTPISETFFVGLLGGALLLSGIRLTFLKRGSEPETRHGSTRPETFKALLDEIYIWAKGSPSDNGSSDGSGENKAPSKLKNFATGAFTFKKNKEVVTISSTVTSFPLKNGCLILSMGNLDDGAA